MSSSQPTANHVDRTIKKTYFRRRKIAHIPPLTDKVVALSDIEHTVLHYTGGRFNLGDLIRDASRDEGFSRGVGWS